MTDGRARRSRQEKQRPGDLERDGSGASANAATAVAILGANLSITGWSAEAGRLSGLSAAFAVGRPLFELFSGIDAGEFARAGQSGESVEVEPIATGREGGLNRLALEIAPLSGLPGEPGGFAVVMRAAAAQRDGVATSPDHTPRIERRKQRRVPPVFLVDPDDTAVLDASEPAARLLGLDRRELAGKLLDDLLREAGAVIGSDGAGGIMDDGELSLPDAGSAGTSRAYVSSVVPFLSSGKAFAAVVLHEVTRWLDLEAELSRANVELSRMARHDHLTGLFNKAMFLDTLALANSRLERTGGMLGVLYIDLDGFKPVNDRFGHDAGDRVLAEVAQRLRWAMRASDVVARLGGDEFGAILENLRVPEDALKVGRHIIEQIAQPLDVAGTPVVMSASIGAVVTDRMVPDSGALLIQADWQMYQAKSTGHGQVALGRARGPGNDRQATPGG